MIPRAAEGMQLRVQLPLWQHASLDCLGAFCLECDSDNSLSARKGQVLRDIRHTTNPFCTFVRVDRETQAACNNKEHDVERRSNSHMCACSLHSV